jgi:S-layer homology domain
VSGTSRKVEDCVAAAQFYGLIQGDASQVGKPLNTFRPNDPINRAEVAKIIALSRKLLGK